VAVDIMNIKLLVLLFSVGNNIKSLMRLYSNTLSFWDNYLFDIFIFISVINQLSFLGTKWKLVKDNMHYVNKLSHTQV
jgi:hypothetical protein